MKTIIVFFLVLVVTVYTLSAQEGTDTINVFDMTLEQLLDIKVISASKTEQKLSDAPAIMSLITAQQIRERSYESVVEALKTVPGLSIVSFPNVLVPGNGKEALEMVWSLVPLKVNSAVVTSSPELLFV